MSRNQITLKKFYFFAIGLLFIFGSCNYNGQKTDKMKAPQAEMIKKELSIHGDTRIDNYYWLNDRENPKVIEYLEAENSYRESLMSHTVKLKEKLYDEIIGRIKQSDLSVPYKLNGYFYYTRYEEGMEYPFYCRKKESLENEEEIMLNVNEMAKGHSFFNVTGISVSPNNKILAFGVDTVSRRMYTIYFKDLTTGELFEDRIPNTTGYVPWANDNKTVYYTIKDETLRPYKIFRHVLGSDIKDREIYEEVDNTFTCFIYKTKSRDYLMIGSSSTVSDEYRFIDANDPEGEFKVIQPRERDLEYSVAQFGDKFYIRTNYEAKNFRLMETPVIAASKENWKEVIQHRDDVLLESIDVFRDFLVVEERKSGLTQIRIIKWNDWSDHYIDFGEPTYLAYTSRNFELDTDSLRYGYTSLTTPNSVYDYNMITREKKLMKQQEIVGDFNSENYQAERLYAPTKDGVKVPISLVYRKGIKKNGKNPCLLYGYGSYGSSMDAYFSSSRLSLLDRGFIFAIAHIRGGEEMGRQWYEDGKLLKKKNTFTDFISCGEYLVKENYTSPDELYAMGGSAGGLLIGAVINMSPDLFKGAVAQVPFVDVVTTMLDESIPLTTGEFDEWGNPNDKEYYDYMLSYSPYDNVEAKDYPALLVTTGLHDSQVQYWEPAKWVAKLREMKTDDNLLVLYINMDVGHGGASGRFQRYKETALEYAFLLDLAGIKK
ncbi:MAG: S9 family peptidase [Bacteroidales bacterium]|nr:S9 family peptidase [Bacteroidales bacterium]